MSEALSPIVGREADGTIVLKSPKVGVWSDVPASGTVLGPGSPLGVLTQLGRVYPLRVPGEIAGRIAPSARRDLAIPVGYGEVLVCVEHAGSMEVSAPASPGAAAATSPPSGGSHVVAPTDGVFYGSPGPGAAPFVVPGQRIASGQTIGLIEVMKTFNPIAYGGDGLPDEAEVAAVLVADGREVRAGQPLVAIR